MSQTPFVLHFPGEYNEVIVARVSQDLARYEVDNSGTMGIDLSKVSILRSHQIGLVARAIKAAEAKKEQAVILAPDKTVYKILKAVHFDRKAQIVLDQGEFEKALAKPEPPSALNKESLQDDSPIMEVPERKPSKSLGRFVLDMLAKHRFVTTFVFGVIVLLLLALAWGIVFVVQSQSTGKDRAQDRSINAALQKRADSLSAIIKQKEEEEKLLEELDRATNEPTGNP